MHTDYVASPEAVTPVNFLWLELTNQCNLECVHCYADSGPNEPRSGKLTTTDYFRLIDEAVAVGCPALQFIGGEPTLNKDLPALIRHAHEKGVDRIEVFTNMTRLSDELVAAIVDCGVHLATSVYADVPEVHDRVTTSPGSFEKTVRNVKRALALDIPVRVGIISMAENEGHTEPAADFLRSLGVANVSISETRGFGRGLPSGIASMKSLCGECSGGTLCVDPDGKVSPCIMSKLWPIGDVTTQSIGEIAKSSRAKSIRTRIGDATVAVEGVQASCDPKNCCPATMGCAPCTPYCSPVKGGCIPCIPKG